MTIADLIQLLEHKDQTAQVEFVIVQASNGKIIAINIQEQAEAMRRTLEYFK